MTWLDSITNSTDMSLSKFWETAKDREALSSMLGVEDWHAAVHGVTKSWTRLKNNKSRMNNAKNNHCNIRREKYT